MTCYHPTTAFRLLNRFHSKTGKPLITFSCDSIAPSDEVQVLQVPCGKCIGCSLSRSRQWAIRCVHEASLYPSNCFITLTYAPEFLPAHGSLLKSDLQKFFKRLRKRFPNDTIRYYACGEYGSRNERPHYHAIIFGFDFPDKEVFFYNKLKQPVYRSSILEKLWPFGISSVGSVNYESAAYVARYCLKKSFGSRAAEKYILRDDVPEAVLCFNTNNSIKSHWFLKQPEFNLMSLKPGIGYDWYNKYKEQVYTHDYITLLSKSKVPIRLKPPRFYDKLFDLDYPVWMEMIRDQRQKYFSDMSKEDTSLFINRLAVSERCKKFAIKRLKRCFEND